MSDGNAQRQSPVARARGRLEHAVAQVEAALDERLKAAGENENALARELEAARQENAALRHANETVSRRLDGAIDRLRAVLEG